MKSLKILTFIYFFVVNISVYGQYTALDTFNYTKNNLLSVKTLLIPTALTVYGFASLSNESIRQVDFDVRNQINSKKMYKIDDYLIYLPMAADIGLTFGGYKSKHNYKEKAALYFMSTTLNAVLVYPVKALTSRARPDESDLRSFPSGHTSNAFVGAEYFWQEYKTRSKWLAASGYVVAATTGYFRLQNNKHWFSDVLTGAGIGMLSTKVCYWLFPMVKKIVKPNQYYTVFPSVCQNYMAANLIYYIK
ncbi:MAG: phosphatase PAP2 family protein [Saprospiraceae bacterium]|nr:phosphatase PAP2 family protein [Saprospiraceae bacterium]MBP6565542.1 phosphatase PAP2 family protein [Saprospiraceae bacterium]